MTSVKEVVKSKGAAKNWLWWYRLIAKIFITTIQVNFVLILVKLGWGNINWTELLLLKFLPSTYTITAISQPPPLISQPFHMTIPKQYWKTVKKWIVVGFWVINYSLETLNLHNYMQKQPGCKKDVALAWSQKCLQVIPNPFQKVVTKLYKSFIFSQIFYWLTDWLTNAFRQA